jgi:hypothetical protein
VLIRIVGVEVRNDAVEQTSCVTPHTLVVLLCTSSENVWNDPTTSNERSSVTAYLANVSPRWCRYLERRALRVDLPGDEEVTTRDGDRQLLLQAFRWLSPSLPFSQPGVHKNVAWDEIGDCKGT